MTHCSYFVFLLLHMQFLFFPCHLLVCCSLLGQACPLLSSPSWLLKGTMTDPSISSLYTQLSSAASEAVTNAVTLMNEQCSTHLCRTGVLHQNYIKDPETPFKWLARG